MGDAVCKRLQLDKVQNKGYSRQAGREMERKTEAEMASYELHFNFPTKSFRENQITFFSSCY